MRRFALGTWVAMCAMRPAEAQAFTTQFATPQFAVWWEAIYVTADQPIAGVDMSIDMTDWRPLSATSYGAWVTGVYIPSGSLVDFRAHSSTGEVSLSAKYRYPDSALMTPPPASAAPCPSGCAPGHACCQTSAMANIAAADKRFDCLPLSDAGVCPAPDLWVDAAMLSSYHVEADCLDPSNCDVAEGCAGASGIRILLRFDASIVNVGNRDLVMTDPSGFPWFVYDPCHGHSHFQGFSAYRLLAPDGGQVATARKQGFCLADDHYYFGAEPRYYTCTYQGLSVGWADHYSSNLPCQYIDVTDVPPGDYILQIQVNPTGALYESNVDNNVAEQLVTLPFFSAADGGCSMDAGAPDASSSTMAIAPPFASVAPKGTQTFTAAGGTGTGYVWSLLANKSGAVIGNGGTTGLDPGVYVAGATGDVTDTVMLTDSAGNVQLATVTVGASVGIFPSSATVPPRGTQTFTASGGSGSGYLWTVLINASGGSIQPQGGIYTAGAIDNVADVVRVTDSLGNVSDVSVTVTSAICELPGDAGSGSASASPGCPSRGDGGFASPRAGCGCTSSGGSAAVVGLLLFLSIGIARHEA